MEQCHSGEANIPQTLNKLPFLWNLRIIYCVHHSLPLVPVLRQMNSYYPPIYAWDSQAVDLLQVSPPVSFVCFSSHQIMPCALPNSASLIWLISWLCMVKSLFLKVPNLLMFSLWWSTWTCIQYFHTIQLIIMLYIRFIQFFRFWLFGVLSGNL